MATSTTNFGLSLPVVNSATDEDIWGDELNANSSELDALLLTTLNLTPSPQTTSFTITARTPGSATTGSSRIIYICDATSGNITASLPPVAGASGLTVGFKKIDGGTNIITIAAQMGELIDGVNIKSITAQYVYIFLQCDGAKWNIIASGISGASQSDQESGTSTAVAVTPAVQQYHPSAAKAWVHFTVSGGVATIQAAYNVSSVTYSSVGQYAINFTVPFSSANYCTQVTGRSDTVNTVAFPTGQMASLVNVAFINLSGGNTDINRGNIVCFGDQ